MAKLNAKNPLTGNSMSLSPSNIIAMLLGGVLLWGVAATSQNIGKTITQKVNNKYVDFEPDAINRQEKKVVDSTVYYG